MCENGFLDTRHCTLKPVFNSNFVNDTTITVGCNIPEENCNTAFAAFPITSKFCAVTGLVMQTANIITNES